MVPVPDEDLPVLLPANPKLTGEGESPLATDSEFVNVKCPKCGGPARRESDTMDTFVDSSWYFYRYCDPHNDKAPFDPAKAAYWLPSDQYIGGSTDAIMYLLYSRFWCKVMRDLGLVKHDEPIARLFTQGMVQKGGVAMSKSRGNVVGAEEMAQKYGADTGRLYTLFAAPPEKDLEWSEESIEGAWRFLNRVFRLVDKHAKDLGGGFNTEGAEAEHRGHREEKSAGRQDAGATTEKEKVLLRKAHQSLRRVTQDFEGRWHFNSAIAQIMELVNAIYAGEPLEEGVRPAVQREVLELVTLMLAPMTPHLAEELWEMLGHKDGLWTVSWPAINEDLAKEDEVEIPVQVNGKVRGRVKVAAGASQEEVMERAREDAGVAGHLNGKAIRKVIFVADKMLNVVVG
jgi:leucyl-tRNA synthetase